MSTRIGRPSGTAFTSGSRRALSVALAAALAVPLGAGVATAAVEPLSPPQHIEVFPDIDMVGVAGFEGEIVVEVWRDGVKIGTTGRAVLPSVDPLTGLRTLEINHDSAFCWDGVTPDIVAGDQIRVVTADDGAGNVDAEFIHTSNVSANNAELFALDSDGVFNDVVMRGRARTLDGTAPLSLGLVSAEIVAPAMRDAGVPGWDSRALGAVPGGFFPTDGDTPFPNRGDGHFAYDPVGPGNEDGSHWTATWKNMPSNLGELMIGGEHAVLAIESESPLAEEGVGLTIQGAGDSSGGAPGCPPGISDAVTGTNPANVNIAARNAGGNFVINGTSHNASAVRVTVDDGDGGIADAITVNAVVTNAASLAETAAPVAPIKQQTWRAVVPMSQITGGALADGELSITSEMDRVSEKSEERTETRPVLDEAGNPVLDEAGNPVTEDVTSTVYVHTANAINGRPHSLLKDLVAPLVPTVFPAGGTYFGATQVSFNADDELDETVRFRVGNPALDPGPGSTIASAPYTVSLDQQVKSRSYDRVGNASPIRTDTYNIEPLGRPGAPTGVTPGTPGDGFVPITWTAPASNGGSEIVDYVVEVWRGGVLQPALTQSTGDGAATDWAVGGLTNGVAYQFTVRAENASGLGNRSARSVAATPTAPVPAPLPTAPTGVAATAGNASASVRWTAPSNAATSNITEYQVQVRTGTTVVRTVTGIAANATSTSVTGLTNGTAYNFRVRAVSGTRLGALSAASTAVTPQAPVVGTAPGAPARPTATAGVAGGAITASVAWVPPTNTGGSAITGYQVRALRVTTAGGAALSQTTSVVLPATQRNLAMTLPVAGNYQFQVRAINAVGSSNYSSRSAMVAGR